MTHKERLANIKDTLLHKLLKDDKNLSAYDVAELLLDLVELLEEVEWEVEG